MYDGIYSSQMLVYLSYFDSVTGKNTLQTVRTLAAVGCVVFLGTLNHIYIICFCLDVFVFKLRPLLKC